MEIRSFFSDESDNYQSLVPGSDGTYKIRFRCGRYQALAVKLYAGPKQYEMKWDCCINNFDFYCCEVETHNCGVSYFFEIHTSEEVAYYGRTGIKRKVERVTPFRILPFYDIPEWTRGAVMYQIFTDRFRDGDPDNNVADGEYFYIGKAVEHSSFADGQVKPDDVGHFFGGDLQGIIDKLDHLESLGVEVILLNPIFVSPSNHKYDSQDYDHVDPHLGVIVNDAEIDRIVSEEDPISLKYKVRTTDPENLKASDELLAKLIELAHARGMKVMLDGVFNHCGAWNRWFDAGHIYSGQSCGEGAFCSAESRYRGYYGFCDDGSCEYWYNEKTLPKLNYENCEELCNEIIRIGCKWVSPPYNADGWRLDVAADLGHSEEYNHEFWRRFRREVKKANPQAFIVAEHYDDPGAWLDGTQWDSVMNYRAFMDPVSLFLTGMEKHSDYEVPELKGRATEFKRTLGYMSAEMSYRSLLCAMNQLDNHDHSRFLTRTNGTVGRLKDLGSAAASENIKPWLMRQAAVFQMTWPGMPCIYYGDEAGVCGFTDPDSRRPYPWGSEDEKMLSFYRELAVLRKQYPVIRNGSTMMLKADSGIFCFARFTDEEQLFVIISTADEGCEAEIPIWAAGKAGYEENEEMTQVLAVTRSGSIFRPVKLCAHFGILKVMLPPHSALVIA